MTGLTPDRSEEIGSLVRDLSKIPNRESWSDTISAKLVDAWEEAERLAAENFRLRATVERLSAELADRDSRIFAALDACKRPMGIWPFGITNVRAALAPEDAISEGAE